MSILGALFQISDEEWMARGLCQQVGGDCWWPDKGQNNKVRDAKRICALCEVRPECADWAVRVDDRHAVLGGFSNQERQRMKRGEPVEFKPPERRRRVGESKTYDHVCGHCGSEFRGHPHARYCGKDCKVAAEAVRYNKSRRKTEDAA